MIQRTLFWPFSLLLAATAAKGKKTSPNVQRNLEVRPIAPQLSHGDAPVTNPHYRTFAGQLTGTRDNPDDKARDEGKVVTFAGKDADTTMAQYEKLVRDRDPYRKQLDVGRISLADRVKTTVSNLRNQVTNAYDNTVGYVLAQKQNWDTSRALRKDPDNTNLVYVMNGLAQNIGPGHRRGKALMQHGLRPYHVKSHHSLPDEQAYQKFLGQVDRLHERAKVQNPQSRHDGLVGHSSGGVFAMYAAEDKRTPQRGIKYAQAIASDYDGMPLTTPSQKLMNTFIPLDAHNPYKTRAAREKILSRQYRGPPRISVESVGGQFDDLVPPPVTYYKHADRHHVVLGEDSTHFGTSGSNDEMNKILADLLVQQRDRTKPKSMYQKVEYKRAA
ncbi:alpha/beta hydrolase [Candidatus Woesearchaeota archaeon]|nr:alpha/beta hydrolase [Candidatus Woesearchaeota archaeon]